MIKSPEAKARKTAYNRAYRLAHLEEGRAYQRSRRAIHAVQARARYVNNRQRILASIREKAYGISQSAFDEILSRQGGVCAICKQPNWSGAKGPHVDHDHATGKVRGIVCGNCNLALGHVHDDLAIVQAMAEYLKKFGKGGNHERITGISQSGSGSDHRAHAGDDSAVRQR